MEAKAALRFVNYDPSENSPRDIYKLMIGSIVPRPIAFVSTVDLQGVRNLAPFSFFTAVCSAPPTVLFCPGVRAATKDIKDTLRNVQATGEFVLNVVSEAFAGQMNACSGEYLPEVDEFALSGLTAIPSELVRPPRVAESLVQMECRLRQVVTISDKPGGGSIVIGEIILIHAREDVVRDFKIDPDLLGAIGRMGGAGYCRTRDRFDMERPK